MQKHIVLIEDDEDIRQLITLILNGAGYRVTSFTEMSAYEELAALNADCFLLDEQLPGVSGHIICILLKSKEPTKNTPVILASGSPKLNVAAKLADADATIKKPFDVDEFIATIKSVVPND